MNEERQGGEAAAPDEREHTDAAAANAAAPHKPPKPDKESAVTLPPIDVALLSEQLAEAERERDQFRNMAMRAQADLTNYKRRAAEEQVELRRSANADLIGKLLEVVDNFERAIGMLPAEASDGWREGLSLVQRNLMNILETEGVSKIDAAGKPFDPWEHEAVFHQETSDAEDGVIIAVTREGYRLHNRVLRASQVIVAKAPAAGPEQETH